jgi:hypothetical protein
VSSFSSLVQFAAAPASASTTMARLAVVLSDIISLLCLVKALFRSVERTFDRVDHSEIETDVGRSVFARFDVDTSGADIETSIRQTSTHERREIVESVYPNIALIDVMHRTCLPSSIAIRFELHTGSSLMTGFERMLLPVLGVFLFAR